MNQNTKDQRCGAKTRVGNPCRKHPVPGRKRCRLHGGCSTGPRDPAKLGGNANAVVHGIYSQRLAPEEEALVDEIRARAGTLDEELVVARLQLRRAVMAQDDIQGVSAEDDSTGFELSEVKSEGDLLGEGESGMLCKRTTVRRRPDFRAVIDRLLGRVAHLEQVRAGLKLEEVVGLPQLSGRFRFWV